MSDLLELLLCIFKIVDWSVKFLFKKSASIFAEEKTTLTCRNLIFCITDRRRVQVSYRVDARWSGESLQKKT